MVSNPQLLLWQLQLVLQPVHPARVLSVGRRYDGRRDGHRYEYTPCHCRCQQNAPGVMPA